MGQLQCRAMNLRISSRSLPVSVRLLALATLSVVSPALAQPDKHPFGLDDYSALRRARALSVSPDGTNILYELSWDGMKGPTKREWHLISVSGENDRKLDLPDSFEPHG